MCKEHNNIKQHNNI